MVERLLFRHLPITNQLSPLLQYLDLRARSSVPRTLTPLLPRRRTQICHPSCRSCDHDILVRGLPRRRGPPFGIRLLQWDCLRRGQRRYSIWCV
jgi:hypothetical protein